MQPFPYQTAFQWRAWVKENVPSPFRQLALKAALASLAIGASSDQAVAVANEAVRRRADSRAAMAIVGGIVSAGVGLSVGGLSILGTLLAIAAVNEGRFSERNGWQAWVGFVLALLGVSLFVIRGAAKFTP